MTLIFEPITATEEQIALLYDLLKNRAHNISHASMPDFSAHQAFVQNPPYRNWYLLKNDAGYIGTLYVQNDNSVAIHMKEEAYQDCLADIFTQLEAMLAPLPEVKSVRPAFFWMNVAPSNKELMTALEATGCRLIQYSYRISAQFNAQLNAQFNA